MKIAKAAGMKYIVITAKHHDGFAMFHTSVDGYNIYDATPWHHDPLRNSPRPAGNRASSSAFIIPRRRTGIIPAARRPIRIPTGTLTRQHHWDPAQQGSMDDYIKNVAVPQVKELLTNYGPGVPAVLWWDTPVGMTPERAEKFLPLLKLKPGISS